MSSENEKNDGVAMRVAFDDEPGPAKKSRHSKPARDDGIEPIHHFELDDRKKRKGDKESKKKKSKDRKTKEKIKRESEVKPKRGGDPPPIVVEPEIESETPEKKEAENPKQEEKKIPEVSENKTPQESKETKKLQEETKKKSEHTETEVPERKPIRAATRRDFYDDGTEPDRRKNREEKDSNSSMASNRKQDKPKRDACTDTRDCNFEPAPDRDKKDSWRDLCETRKSRERGAESCRWDTWCDDKLRRNDERISRESRSKNCGESSEGRGDDVKGGSRKRPRENERPTDEITQLKNDLMNIQCELEKLKECLRAAERHKCAIARMKQQIRCTFPCRMPDLAKIREKLKNCHVMKMNLCREARTCPNRDCWRKDFETLMNEVNAIRFELEKMRKEK